MEYYIAKDGYYKKSYRGIIIIAVLSFLLLFSTVTGAIGTIGYKRKLDNSLQLIGQYRDAEQRAAEIQRGLTDGLDELSLTVGRQSEVISSQATDIGELRRVLTEIQESTGHMEDTINRLRSDYSCSYVWVGNGTTLMEEE